MLQCQSLRETLKVVRLDPLLEQNLTQVVRSQFFRGGVFFNSSTFVRRMLPVSGGHEASVVKPKKKNSISTSGGGGHSPQS